MNIDFLMFTNDGHNPYHYVNGRGGLGYKPNGNMLGTGSGAPSRVRYDPTVIQIMREVYFDNPQVMYVINAVSNGSQRENVIDIFENYYYETMDNIREEEPELLTASNVDNQELSESDNEIEDIKIEGGMIGGMAKRDEYGKLKSQYIDDNDDENMLDVNTEELPELINMDKTLKNEPEKKINIFMSEIFDIAKAHNDDLEDYNDNVLNIHDLDRRRQDAINSFDSLFDAVENIITDRNVNFGGDNIITLMKIRDKLISGEKINYIENLEGSENAIKNIKKLNYTLNDFDDLSERIDHFSETSRKSKDATTRGNISEEILTENPLLLQSIDHDNSKFKNSKDITAFSRDYRNKINDITNGNPNDLLQYVPIDGIKSNTLWELKSFSLDKNSKFRNEYSVTKLKDGKSNYNNKPIIYNFLYNVENPNFSHVTYDEYIEKPQLYGKITSLDNISFIYNNEQPIRILPERTKGYKYFFLENTPKGFRYANPIEDINEHKLENKKFKISQKPFRSIPATYELQNKHKNVREFINERRK